MRDKLYTNSQIMLRFAWKLHKRRKKIKAEKKKKAADAKAKKKGKFGSTRRTGSSA